MSWLDGEDQRSITFGAIGSVVGWVVVTGVLALVGAIHSATDIALLALWAVTQMLLVKIWIEYRRERKALALARDSDLWRELETLKARTGLTGYASSLADSAYHPSKVLPRVHRSLDFLGHGASKWTREKDKLAKMLLHLGDEGQKCEVRILVLDPASQVCLETSALLFKNDPDSDPLKWPKKILYSLQILGQLEEQFDNLTVKVYEHKPVFRLTIIDDDEAIVGHYRNYHQDSDDSPLIVFRKGPEWNFVTPFQQLFDSEWNAAKIVDWSAVSAQAVKLGVETMGT